MVKKFNDIEDNFIRANYLEYSAPELARMMGRSKFGVSNRLRVLGLEIPMELKQLRIERSRFKRGQEAHNKGVKMSPEVRAIAQRTFFKPGQKPHNTKPVGSISPRADKSGIVYLYIKVSDSNWELLHRHIWEQAHGKIQKGIRIYFKDGNQQNCTIENLIALTDQEAMEKNRITHLPIELQEIIKLNNKLKSKIKNHGKK